MKIFKFSEYRVRRYDFKIILIIAALCVIGYLVLNSAMANDTTRDATLQKQMIGMIVGALLMIFLSFLDYHVYFKIAPFIYIGVIALLVLVLLSGKNVNNATRWLEIAGFRLQPSEFTKIGIIIVFSAYFNRFRESINKPWVLGLSLVMLLAPVYLIYREPDLSTTVVHIFIFLCLLYVAKLSYKWILGAIAVVVPTLGFIVYKLMNQPEGIIKNYQLNRILAWLDPNSFTTSGLTTQQDNSILAISSGQLYGKGLNTTSFESVKNGNFLSEENCDFIFAVVGEELGFVGSIVIIILLLLLVFECFKIAYRAKDMGGRLIATGMGALLSFQGFVNIGVAIGLLPNTGLPLPFLSAGVSSILSLFIGMGVVLNVGLQRKNKESDW